MAKDPAFLFYSSDFLTGTQFFTHEQKGKYITLLCLQHQQGRLREKHMLMICGTRDNDVFEKFIKDADGLYYQPRLELEIEKRKKYSESRRENRLKAFEKPAAAKEKEQDEKITYPFESENFMKVWKHWKDYKIREHAFKYASAQSEQAALKKLAKLSDGVEMVAIEIIVESMANGWKGFFELKNDHQHVTGNRNGASGEADKERNPGIKQAIYDTIGDTSRSF